MRRQATVRPHQNDILFLIAHISAKNQSIKIIKFIHSAMLTLLGRSLRRTWSRGRRIWGCWFRGRYPLRCPRGRWCWWGGWRTSHRASSYSSWWWRACCGIGSCPGARCRASRPAAGTPSPAPPDTCWSPSYSACFPSTSTSWRSSTRSRLPAPRSQPWWTSQKSFCPSHSILWPSQHLINL